jgi:predicted nucleotidyltransferase
MFPQGPHGCILRRMDISPYVEFLKRRARERGERREQARKAAVEAMKAEFTSTPSLRRVYLFGSLARDRFREDSDIDLAVEGLDAAAFLRLRAQLQSSTSHPVDLVDLGDCEAKFADFIRMYGRLIYERAH